MGKLRRIVLTRHGETVGNSSVRFHGSSDVGLSDEGRAQMRETARALRPMPVELVVASPLRRAWESAWIAGGGRPVRFERDFREIHFGRWEGLTADEIRERDPIAYEDWQSGAEGFEYPNGEPRAEFAARVRRGLERLLAEPAHGALAVIHKGVIRTIVAELTGDKLEPAAPPLGGFVVLTRAPDGSWFQGERSSNPPGLDPRE